MRIKRYYKNDVYIHYSNCHEDANMIMMHANENVKNVLSIASGGDNSFTCLLLNPDKVTCIDLNITQIYLVELKKIAIKYLNYEEYLVFLGIKDGDSLFYFNKIKEYLSKQTADYFTKYLFLISKVKLVNAGRFEYYFGLFSKKVLPLIHKKRSIDIFMNCRTIEEQIIFYSLKFNNRRFKFMFKIFFSKFVMKKLGRDKEYFKYHRGSLAKQLKSRFEFGIFNNLNKHNPYLQYVMYHKFIDLPLYLQEENYIKIKENIDKIEIKHISLEEALNSGETYDFMNLSDVFEYLDNSLMEYYEDLIYNTLNQKGRIIYWNMQNTRIMGKKLVKRKSYLVCDLAYYYKDLLVYEKE